ncbi:MAG: TIGR02266 family protein [Myxococcota bacterium]
MGDERREHERFGTELSVDVKNGENFLFAYITNISEMGIFIRSDDPLPVGTTLKLSFEGPEDTGRVQVEGTVQWINPVRTEGDNPNPGMGVRFDALTPELREQLVEIVRAVAYLHEQA